MVVISWCLYLSKTCLNHFRTCFLFATLQELVPCVLLSFDDEQILMWRGSEWKSMYGTFSFPSSPVDESVADLENSGTCKRGSN